MPFWKRPPKAPSVSIAPESPAAISAGDWVVGELYSLLEVESEWCIPRPGGFTWWPGSFAQSIWADPPFEDKGHQLARVHVETEMLRGFRPTAESLGGLLALQTWATLDGCVVDGDSVRLVSHAYVHDGTTTMWKVLLLSAAMLQLHEVRLGGSVVAGLADLDRASSSHPQGARTAGHPALTAFGEVFVPAGKHPSRFVEEDYEAAKQLAWEMGWLALTGTGSLTCEFPYSYYTSLLRLETDQRHPLLGNGLLVSLTLPTEFEEDWIPDLVVDLNRRELEDRTLTPFIGSWCPAPRHPGLISHVSFVPNVCALPGLPMALMQYAWPRSLWVEHLLVAEGRAAKNRHWSGLY